MSVKMHNYPLSALKVTLYNSKVMYCSLDIKKKT